MRVRASIRLLALLAALSWLPAVAQASSGVVISTGATRAEILMTDDVFPGDGARVTVSQSDLFGSPTGHAFADVTAVNGAILTLSIEGALVEGPAEVALVSGDEITAGAGVGEGGAVGMRVGSLEPNFALPGDEDPGEAAGTRTDTAGGAADDGADMQRILALVREWIAVAKPALNAKPGYHLQYTEWGQVFGTTPSGTITVNAKPDDAGGISYDVYLWTRYPDLASLNHCTLSQYVSARLETRDIADCGRRGGPAEDHDSAPGGGEVPSIVAEDDASEQPQPIPGTASISGRILPRADRDEFVFEASHHGEWSFTVDSEPAGVDLRLGVYPAPKGNWLPDVKGDRAVALVVDIPKPGAYILRITGANGGMPSEEPYRVGALFRPSPDRFEPNHDVEQAPSIEGTRELVGTILPRAERDQFIFETDHHGEWAIDVASAPEGVDVTLGVFPHPKGNWLPDMAPDEEGRLVVDLPEPGKYVLRAAGANGGMRSVEPYTLDLAFTPSPDRFEPNQNVEEAPSIEGTRELVGTILPRAERDEFIFETDHHGEWAIEMASAPEGVDVTLGVFPHPKGNWLPDMAPDEEGRLVVDLPKPGKYVLRAAGANGGMRSVEPYTLDLTFTPSPDQFEPNQNVEEAKAIIIGGTILGTILPRGERDEFTFSASGPAVVAFVTMQSPPGVKIVTGVYPAPKGNWLRDHAPDDPNRLLVELPEAGQYVLRVTAANGGMRSIQPYRISITPR